MSNLISLSLQWSRQPEEDEQQNLHTIAPGPGSVQQPVTPAQLDGIALPVGATPISIPGTGALPLAAGLPPGVLPTGSVAVPAAAEQQYGWHAAGPEPSAPRPPRPLPRLLPRPSMAGASAAAHPAGVVAPPMLRPPEGDAAYHGAVVNGLLPPLEEAAGDAAPAFEDQSRAPMTIPGPDGFATPPEWFAAQYGQTAGPPGVVITATKPAGFDRVRAAHKELRAQRHVIQARPAAMAPQRHALTPRVARPSGLTALESLLRPSRAAELAAEQVLRPCTSVPAHSARLRTQVKMTLAGPAFRCL